MRFGLPSIRFTRRRVAAGLALLTGLGALITWAAWPAPKNYTARDALLNVMSGPAGNEPVTLDTTFFVPDGADADNPVPAILLAHGFGGTKRSMRADAEDLANAGYAVLTWTAQGFSGSTGKIHLNSPDYEVRDARSLVDWLAARPEVLKDPTGDPKVGVVGGSYGGALALLLAGHDPRVDAIVPMITWNDLSKAFLPEATGQPPTAGVFKKQWAGVFFSSGSNTASGGLAGALAGIGRGDDEDQPRMPETGTTSTSPDCGNFARDICDTYLRIAATGKATEADLALLRRSSPTSVLDRIKAPTMLIQGQADSLFPLTEADANARGIAANGTPVHVDWFTGGHDGGAGPQADSDRGRYLTLTWLDHYLRGKGDVPDSQFTYSRITGFNTSSSNRRPTTSAFSVERYPGLGGTGNTAVDVAGKPQQIFNPPGGTPAAMSTIPGASSLSSLISGISLEIPGQHADFLSPPLTGTLDVLGTPTVTIRAASPTGEAVLFVKLYDVDPSSGASLPFGLVAPVRLTGLQADIAKATPVTVTLPAIAARFEAGHRLMITISTTDQGFATPAEPAVYTVGVGVDDRSTIGLPLVTGTPIATQETLWRWLLAGLVATLAVGLAVVLFVARRRRHNAEIKVIDEYADTPLVVRGLRKEYADGFVAVAQVDFTVERGQVVGLLGPNGAGKTTSLRVLMGLTRPTKGEVLVFGHRLTPGAPVLSRLGALVEGPGFLPHLSGIENLRLYWRSTGRPDAEAHLDEALEIAGLGDAVQRKVRTYSHGMRQRLAIAQAMLGLPELLVLDEPTDGLDPPQIAEMRKVLREYARDGRAVLVSSHLLAEVEQTCTHVVVMHKGEIVASGEVADIVGDSPVAQFEVSDVPAAEQVLASLAAVRSVNRDGRSGLVVDLNGTSRADVVSALVGAGVGVDRVVPRRRLEDAFLSLVGGNTRASGER
ncbi:alpha/beta fold hydrolase [Luedemannella helvata]